MKLYHISLIAVLIVILGSYYYNKKRLSAQKKMDEEIEEERLASLAKIAEIFQDESDNFTEAQNKFRERYCKSSKKPNPQQLKD